MMKFWPLLIMLITITSDSFGATSYHIGNSLTWDSMADTKNGVQGFEALAATGGVSVAASFHIRSSFALHSILADPADVTLTESPAGTFDNALPNFAWDYITLQPHISQGSTLGLDTSSILSFIDLAKTNPSNASTVFLIYQTWPRQSQGPYQSFWESPSPDVDSTPTLMKAEYFEHLLKRVTDQTDAIVRLIPTGEVFFEIDKRLAEGGIPGFSTLSDFYRDDVHLSNVGRFIASSTVYATMFQKNPKDLVKPADFFGDPMPFTPDFYSAIADTIWDVVTRNRFTGLSDFNDDGLVDEADLGQWQTSYANNVLGDADDDGDTDGSDFLIWQRQATQSISQTSHSAEIPELPLVHSC